MNEVKLAIIYAKALVKLSEVSNFDSSEQIAELNNMLLSSPDLEKLLFLDIFTVAEKITIFETVSERSKFSDIFKNYILFLIEERRINLFHMIYKNVVLIEDEKKGLIRGIIEGNVDEVDKDIFEKLRGYIASRVSSTPVLEYRKSDKITAGYKINVQDYLLDATIDSQIGKFKNESQK